MALHRKWLRATDTRARAARLLTVFAVFVVALAAMTLSLSVSGATKTALGNRGVLGKLNEHLNPFRSRNLLHNCTLPVYDLEIANDQLARHQRMIDEARRHGTLTDDMKEWITGTFMANDDVFDVKLRVRGNNPSHWIGDRKSWRVRFPKRKPFQGQREFNLILPTDSKGINQAFSLNVYRKLGFVAQRDGYCLLRVNGVTQGVYYCVEHFDAPMLANNQRPDSSLFSNPSNALTHASYKEQITDGAADAWRALDILLAFEASPTPETLERALAVTDVENLLQYVAVTTAFCSDHNAMITDNHKLYYDSSVGRIQRVPWDAAPQRIPRVQRFELPDTFATFDMHPRWPMSQTRQAVVTDPALRLRRDQFLWELVKGDSLVETLDKTFAGMALAFWSDVVGRGDEEVRIEHLRNIIDYNARYIRAALQKKRVDVTIREGEQGTFAVEIGVGCAAGADWQRATLRGLPPESSVTLHRDVNGSGTADDNDVLISTCVTDGGGLCTLAGPASAMLPRYAVIENYPAYVYFDDGQSTGYKTKPIRCMVSPEFAAHRFVMTAAMSESTSSALPQFDFAFANSVTSEPYAPAEIRTRTIPRATDFAPERRRFSRARFLRDHPEFVAGDGNGVTLQDRDHTIDRVVIVPENVPLTIAPGTTVKMGAGAAIVCFGSIHADGTADQPIRIIPREPDENWLTLASVQPGAPCVFRHVYVEGGIGGTVDGILFTGAIAVHHGDATIQSSAFTRIKSEDGINVKHGHVNITDCTFDSTVSDALDLDFVTGTVAGCRFTDIGGDGIDVSGSTVSLEDNLVRAAYDKGISIGEESHVAVRRCLILDSGMGVAVKDKSTANVESCTLVGNSVSLAAYVKKPIFGAAAVRARECLIADTDETSLAGAASSIELIDCMVVPGRSRNDESALVFRENLRRNGYVLNSGTAAAIGNTEIVKAGIPERIAVSR